MWLPSPMQTEHRQRVASESYAMKRAAVCASHHDVVTPLCRACFCASTHCDDAMWSAVLQDARDLNGVIKHAAAMISELQTGLLTPKSYFELYMEVFDQMAHLEMYFASLPRAGVSLSSVFEVVQYTGSVLVRLYVPAVCIAYHVRRARTCWPALGALHPPILPACAHAR
ncbi:MAG: hypothetical protein EOO41_01630 [Methanobacteriota archaeon]|nr:MAG: hypothetical protein EOO41_01630 [Euryarchaeota archaeon]